MPQYWLQQAEPLYPKILWNRPVSRHGAGRLLIAGGHAQSFSGPTALYQLAQAAGIGECTVALPDSLLKLLAGSPGTAFVASSASGSLGREALGQLLELSEEADAVALGLDLSNNSETSLLIECLLQETDRPVAAFAEALSLLPYNLSNLTGRPGNLLIMTMPELFKLANLLEVPLTIRPDGGLVARVEVVQALAGAIAADVVVFGPETIVAAGGEPIVTPASPHLSRLPALYYAVLSVFWLQNQTQPAAGLATAAWIIKGVGEKLTNDQPTLAQVATLVDQLLAQ